MQSNKGLRHVGVWLAAAGMPVHGGTTPGVSEQIISTAQPETPPAAHFSPAAPDTPPLFTNSKP
jgi:hypothetical protein